MPQGDHSPDSCPDCEWDFDNQPDRIASVAQPEGLSVAFPYQINISGASDALESIYTAYVLNTYLHNISYDVKHIKNTIKTFVTSKALHVRRSVTSSGRDELFGGEDWIAYVTYWMRSNTATVNVAAVDEKVAQEIWEEIRRRIPIEEKPHDPHIVEVNYWRRAAHGYSRNARNIDVRTWQDISDNYPRVDKGLEKLISLTPEEIRGRLILLYGPPGTGKTTFLRAVSTEWRDWCSFECVMDPELMFSDSSYLQEVMFGDYGADNDKWHLVILEDTGELIAQDAKTATGQALSRLLNMTDGILGQGAKVLVAITANERLEHMHKAITRPGRCLAQVEIGKFSFEQARTWMDKEVGESAPLKNREYTLADLIALRNGEDIPEEDDLQIGQYA